MLPKRELSQKTMTEFGQEGFTVTIYMCKFRNVVTLFGQTWSSCNVKPIHLLQQLCGLPINTYFSAVKLRWLLDNCEAVKKAVEEDRCLFGTVDSWLIWVRKVYTNYISLLYYSSYHYLQQNSWFWLVIPICRAISTWSRRYLIIDIKLNNFKLDTCNIIGHLRHLCTNHACFFCILPTVCTTDWIYF